MTSIDPTTLTPLELAGMLAAWAEGDYACEAAVGLLTHGARGHWLRRRDFLTACVTAVDDGWTRDGTVPMAVIDWDDLRAFLDAGVGASSGELAVLRTAASLAGAEVGPLGEVTSSLDESNLTHVLNAIAHKAGWHEYGTTRTVTGHQHALGLVDDPQALPSFEDIRARAYAVLGDAEDWLRSDWRPGTGPTPQAATALRQAVVAIAQAKTALNIVACHQRGTR